MFPSNKVGIGARKLSLAVGVASTVLVSASGAFAQSATDIIRELAPIAGQSQPPAPPPPVRRPDVGDPGPAGGPPPGGPPPGFDPGPPPPGPGFGPPPGAGFGPPPGPGFGPPPAAGFGPPPGPGFGPPPGPPPGAGFDPGPGPAAGFVPGPAAPGPAPGIVPGLRVEDTDLYIDGHHTRAYVDYSRAIDLTVYFEYNSAKVTDGSRETLDRLGEALASPELKQHRFLIAGHTDGVGTDEINLDLSYRRAQAVRDYLVHTHGIPKHRIAVKGWGRSRLKDPAHPEAGVNRRVEVALIVDRAIGYLDGGPGYANTQYKGGRPWFTCPPGSRLIDPLRPDLNIDDFAAGSPNPMCRPN